MASQQPPILTLTVAIVGVRFFGISRSVFRYAERIVSHSAVFSSLASLRANIFIKISQTPISEMRLLLQGSTAKKIIDDVERAQEYQLRDVLPRMSAIFSVGVGTLIGLWITPYSLYFTIPALVIFFIMIPLITNLSVVKPAYLLEDREGELATTLSISQAELREAEIFGYRNSLLESPRRHISVISLMEQKLSARTGALQLLTLLSLGTALICSILVARSLDNPPSVRITMTIFIPLVIYEAVSAWYPSLFTSAKLVRAQRSVDELISISYPPKESDRQPVGFGVEGRDVEVSWGQGFMAPHSFKASPQNPLLITGENGAGKSTLALGLSGLLPYKGSLRVCGSEVREIGNPHDFVAASLQSAHIFNTSLRENLKIALQESSDAQLNSVLSLVELDHISLDEMVGEFGRHLSGGEAKRLSVARALLSQAPIVILDEPLEHLDGERAKRIERAIFDYLQDRTLIVIAHSGWSEISNTLHLTR